MSNFSITCFEPMGISECVVMNLGGELSSGKADKLRKEIKKARKDKKKKHFILNCAELTFINSQGIGVIIELIKIAGEHGQQVWLSSLKGQVQEVIELIGIDKIAPVLEHTDKILQSIK